MIRVHHLNNSRSQRVLWLLEETGTPYEVVRYERDPRTMLAPKELRRVHPLGKSPIVEDNDKKFAETGLIIEYLVERYGSDLAPSRHADLYWRYKYWLHYAEGSLMPPLLLKLVIDRLGFLAMPARALREVATQASPGLSGRRTNRVAMVPRRSLLRCRHHVELSARSRHRPRRSRRDPPQAHEFPGADPRATGLQTGAGERRRVPIRRVITACSAAPGEEVSAIHIGKLFRTRARSPLRKPITSRQLASAPQAWSAAETSTA